MNYIIIDVARIEDTYKLKFALMLFFACLSPFLLSSLLFELNFALKIALKQRLIIRAEIVKCPKT